MPLQGGPSQQAADEPKRQWSTPGSIRSSGSMADLGAANTFQSKGAVASEVHDTLVKQDARTDKDEEDSISWRDHFAFLVENLISSDSNSYFYILMIITSILCVALAVLWKICEENSDSVSWPGAVFFAAQVMMAGGQDSTIGVGAPALVYVLLLISGLVVFALFIGVITEKFQAFVKGMSEGRSKVTCSGHTLILGWNETTVRVVVQIALLRRTWQQQNETCPRRCFPWRRVPASSPVAEASVVLMNSQKTKEEMQEIIESAFAEIGISRRRTRIGIDVVCRVGDPTCLQDLKRVGVHRATAILLQMNDADKQVANNHRGAVANGATLRTLLALRVGLFTAQPPPPLKDLRVVAQLTTSSEGIDAISLGEAEDGRPILTRQDLSIFLNSLMFNCTARPGLAYTLLDLLGFEGVALRLRVVKSFQDKGKQLIGKTFNELALMFEDAIPAGIVRDGDDWENCGTTWQKRSDEETDCEGLAPADGPPLKEDDRLIFISETSMPSFAQPVKGTIELDDKTKLGDLVPVNVLVCGWRSEWDAPERFAYRIQDTAEELPNRSCITFLCLKGVDEAANTLDELANNFDDFMKTVCEASPDGRIKAVSDEEHMWTFEDQVKLQYIPGDAVSYKTLRAVVAEREFQQAIILSTMAKEDEKLEPSSRDTRVMAIMLYLRKIQQELMQQPMHIIGENSMDATSYLAMGPTSESGGGIAPDFVNVHAICARALVQSLAYPRMASAVEWLFSGKPGMPRVSMERIRDGFPWGTHTFGSLVQAIKKYKKFSKDVLIGIRQHDCVMVIAPRMSVELHCLRGFMLIMITRRMTKSQKRGDEFTQSQSISSRTCDSSVSAKDEDTRQSCDKEDRDRNRANKTVPPEPPDFGFDPILPGAAQ